MSPARVLPLTPVWTIRQLRGCPSHGTHGMDRWECKRPWRLALISFMLERILTKKAVFVTCFSEFSHISWTPDQTSKNPTRSPNYYGLETKNGSYAIYGCTDHTEFMVLSPQFVAAASLLSYVEGCLFLASWAIAAWEEGTMRSCSYTRKNVHRKKKQGQEVSCIQNGMGVGGEPYIAYDPVFG